MVGGLERKCIVEKDYTYTSYNKNLKEIAINLRKNMTRQEKHLWYDFLRTYPVKFYRQRAIDKYIVDFYCSKAKLVIELDGSQHYTVEGMEYDSIRTDVLERNNLSVLRFLNHDVEKNFADVCKCIDMKIKERIQMQD